MSCTLIIYGSVLPATALRHENVRNGAWECTEDGLLEKPYSGSYDTPFYAGVIITTIKMTWDDEGYSVHQFEPSDAMIETALDHYGRVPAYLREHMTPLGRYVIQCP